MINIPFDPNIISTGSFTLSWHGLLSFVAVAVAVFLVARWAKRDGLDPDIVYNTAVWAIAGGIIGARIVHVADNWHIYRQDLTQIFAIWEGGIGLWGALLGGALAGIAYALFSKYPVRKLLDLTAPALLVAQSIGRIGDIINGEHWSKATSMPWGWYFTDPDSPARIGAQRYYGNPEQPVHPAVVYEMIWNGLVFAVLWKLRGRLKPEGSLYMVYLALYALGRFMIQFIRLDPPKLFGLQEAHMIAILVMAVTVPFIVWKTRFKSPEEAKPGEPKSGEPKPREGRIDRRERRARDRERAKAS
ncbi:MAG: prolipoprotein diacylglyceryl transferase [Chloroflexi bacterium]|nr:prolipoprotein diacylglyceryl transferase [Chloroflexota bacterium]